MGKKGKVIYQPQGKAKEYAEWACNFYTGCSNNCDYCYCKRGVLGHVWSTEPKLKKCFREEGDAVYVFGKEVNANISELRRTGILFSFTTDPLLPETRDLTFMAVETAVHLGVPVKVLTKRADWVGEFTVSCSMDPLHRSEWRHLVAFGFTLTGMDEKEPGASSNWERIDAMRKLHEMGFKTFASIEPVLRIDASYAMINAISCWCDLIMVGLLSGKKEYDKDGVSFLYEMIRQDNRGSRFYLKDSFVEYIGLDRKTLPDQFVTSDYNMFQQHEKKI